jgi:hypothetical protein
MTSSSHTLSTDIGDHASCIKPLFIFPFLWEILFHIQPSPRNGLMTNLEFHCIRIIPKHWNQTYVGLEQMVYLIVVIPLLSFVGDTQYEQSYLY